MIKRSIVVSKETYDKLKVLAAINDKFLYELIDECIPMLEVKYRRENDNE